MVLMTIEMFLILLTFFATLTSLFTEAVKKFLEPLKVKYASNIVVLVVSVIVGGVGMAIYYLMTDIQWTVLNVVCIFLMICSNWLGAMIGYDKIKQAITQLKR
jgi:hypothetical protein